MKLSEIVASLNELKATVASWVKDKANATTDAIGGFSAKLSALETGAVAELTQANADLLAARASVNSLTTENATNVSALEKSQNEVNALGGALKAACTELNLEIKADATSLGMVTVLKGGVSATLAKMNVDPKNIPAPKPATGPTPPTPATGLTGRARMLAATKIA